MPTKRFSTCPPADNNVFLSDRQERGLIVIIVGVMLLLLSPATSANIVASQHASTAKKPKILQPDHGPAIIQIARPNQAGVSHNQYKQFSITQHGAVLANNVSPASSHLKKTIPANPLLLSSPAKIILNEVVTNQKSVLNGPLEVAGNKADIVISNPNGIKINGLRIYNSNHTFITTGRPIMHHHGTLDTLRVTGGKIIFEDQGLLDQQSEDTTIVARSICINAGIASNEINLIAGNNKITYDKHDIRAIDGSETHPVVAIDMRQLGGMYANKIRLIGTESGVGLHDYGEVLLRTTDFNLENEGAFSTRTSAITRHHQRHTRDTSSEDDTSDVPIMPDVPIDQHITDQFNVIPINISDLTATHPQDNTQQHAAVPLPLMQTTPENTQFTQGIMPEVMLYPLPLVGGPFGLIPSPEQGMPLALRPQQGHQSMAILPYQQPPHSQQPNVTAVHANVVPTSPQTRHYGWQVVLAQPASSTQTTQQPPNHGPSWSLVPVGQAPFYLPLGVIPIRDAHGQTTLFLPPNIMGANLSRPASHHRYTPITHGNETWNQAGPSHAPAPIPDYQHCLNSTHSCTAGQAIPSRPADIWPQVSNSDSGNKPYEFSRVPIPTKNGVLWRKLDKGDAQKIWELGPSNIIRQMDRPGLIPDTWNMNRFKDYITSKIFSTHGRWEYNEKYNLYELHSRFNSRRIRTFFNTRTRQIVRILIEPPRSRPRPPTDMNIGLPIVRPQIESVSNALQIPAGSATFNQGEGLIDPPLQEDLSHTEIPPSLMQQVDSANVADDTFWQIAPIETPPLMALPPTPGNTIHADIVSVSSEDNEEL
jgi:filamentous hemagglutinin family protein